jgi:hypothetical protein
MKIRFAVLLVLAGGAANPLHAADRLTALQTAAACAPVPASALGANALRIVGAQDNVVRELYAPGTVVVLSGGTLRGLRADQRYFIRRGPVSGTDWPRGTRGASTSGWLRIVAATESTGLGLVEFACDGVLSGDVLQPFAEPALPEAANRSIEAGTPDFKAAGRVLFGDHERETGANGDFFLVDFASPGVGSIGARLAIYRDLESSRLPLAAVGEGVVTAIYGDLSVVRITSTRDAVRSGDLAVPRRAP